MIRPFSLSAQINCRGYSLLLQRVIVDFGADVAFGRVAEKLKEHYGIEVPASSARLITHKHAEEINCGQEIKAQLPDRRGVDQLIVEMDGSMIPIVEQKSGSESGVSIDERKNKRLRWAEVRLSLARAPGSASPVYGATLGSVDQAGEQMISGAIKAGAGVETNIHGVGDGAPWIAEQMDRKFGSQASYLIDFYHLCEYLAAAAAVIEDRPAWLKEQKQRLTENRIDEVLEDLKPYQESAEVGAADAPVRAFHRYVSNRPGQFNYKEAIAADLPIGSGEIESAHRYVVQQRLKIPGAWWRIDKAANILALRVLRANGEWESYWQGKHQKAA